MLHVTEDTSHPLYALRSFFLRRVSAENELTLPELFEESRRAQVESTRSSARSGRLGVKIRDVDSRLLSRYFDDSFAEGSSRTSAPLESPARRRMTRVRSSSRGDALRNGLGELLGERVSVGRISLSPLASEESIVAELTAWRSGAQSGLFHASVETIGDDGSSRDVRLFVKAKSPDTQSIDVAVALAGLASSTLRDEVHRFRDDLGLTRSHLRELADLSAR